MKKNELWQYRNVLSTDWVTDNVAMNNDKFKTFDDYKKHTQKLNKKFKTMPPAECRLVQIKD